MQGVEGLLVGRPGNFVFFVGGQKLMVADIRFVTEKEVTIVEVRTISAKDINITSDAWVRSREKDGLSLVIHNQLELQAMVFILARIGGSPQVFGLGPLDVNRKGIDSAKTSKAKRLLTRIALPLHLIPLIVDRP